MGHFHSIHHTALTNYRVCMLCYVRQRRVLCYVAWPCAETTAETSASDARLHGVDISHTPMIIVIINLLLLLLLLLIVFY